MKVALILPGFSAAEDDWCIPALLDLVRRLAGCVEVHVFPLRYPRRRGEYRVAGARVHPQGGGTARGAGRLPLLTRALMAVAAEHRRARFDLIHAFWADEPGFLAVTASRLLRVPSIVSLAGGELVGFRDLDYGGQLNPVSRNLTRLSLRFADHVTAGSPYLAQLARPVVQQERLSVLPLGVDTQLFTPSEPAASTPLFDLGAFNLLQVASIVPVKEQAVLLRALSQVVTAVPSVQLHLAGEGPLDGALVDQAARLGLSRHVTFHGSVAHDELPAYYRSPDFCVQSSRHEAQGMVLLEAAACGRPTAGTAVGLLPNLFPDLSVPVGDAGALADVLIRLAQNPALRVALGRQAREAVEREYSLDVTTSGLRALYRRIAEQGALPLPA